MTVLPAPTDMDKNAGSGLNSTLSIVLRASRWLPGGNRSSSNEDAASSWVSFRRATLRIEGEALAVFSPRQEALKLACWRTTESRIEESMHARRAARQTRICTRRMITRRPPMEGGESRKRRFRLRSPHSSLQDKGCAVPKSLTTSAAVAVEDRRVPSKGKTYDLQAEAEAFPLAASTRRIVPILAA